MCYGGGGLGSGCVESIYGVFFDLIPNVQNCFTTRNKNLGGQGGLTDRHLPPDPITGKFLRKDDLRGTVSVKLFGPGLIDTFSTEMLPSPSW